MNNLFKTGERMLNKFRGYKSGSSFWMDDNYFTKDDFDPFTGEEIIQEKKQTAKKEVINEKEEKQETKQSKVQTEEKEETQTVSKIDMGMAKVDAKVKDISKNLVIKNLIKLDVMVSDQISLAEYNDVVFYVPKDIYINQIPIFDNRKIYNDITLVSYVKSDPIEIKTRKLNEIHLKKRELILKLQELQNG